MRRFILALLLLYPIPLHAQALQDPASDRPAEMDRFLAQLLATDDGTSEVSSPAAPAPEPTLPPTTQDRERQAFAQYRETGRPPIIATAEGRSHPFGHGSVELVCIPDRACDVVLEAGEVIDGLAVGDPEHWQTTFLTEGTSAEEAIPHILLQPTDPDLRTNLVIVTSRRTYHVELRSPPQDELTGEDTIYHHLEWWYPESWGQRIRQKLEIEQTPPPPPPGPFDIPVGSLEELDFGYDVEVPRRRARRLPWSPVTVFDDGDRLYLRLPPAAQAHDLPIVLGRTDDGTTYPVNAHVQGEWIVLPSLVEELELVLGAGDDRRFLRIHHQ